MTKINLSFSFIFLLFIFSCSNSSVTPEKSPPVLSKPQKDSSSHNKTDDFKYDLKNPNHTWRLPEQLVEVSGNAWINADHLILIEDLHPNLYLVKIDDKTATLEKNIPFAETDKDKLDIEDVCYVNNVVYALWSHGVLFKITNWKSTPKVERINTGLSKENNTEGLCLDQGLHR